MAGSSHDELEFVRMGTSRGSPRSRAAAEGELADWAFDVEVDPRHPREQIDVGAPDCASAEPHVGRH